jgi:hypothetical protein
MNFVEAIKSKKPFKRESWGVRQAWIVPPEYKENQETIMTLVFEDLFYDDWIIWEKDISELPVGYSVKDPLAEMMRIKAGE